MLNPRVTDCAADTDISSLIEDINCRLKDLGYDLYNNIVFMLNRTVPVDTIISLLHYRRILEYKNVNTSYAEDFTVSMIANRVKLLKFKR